MTWFILKSLTISTDSDGYRLTGQKCVDLIPELEYFNLHNIFHLLNKLWAILWHPNYLDVYIMHESLQIQKNIDCIQKTDINTICIVIVLVLILSLIHHYSITEKNSMIQEKKFLSSVVKQINCKISIVLHLNLINSI